MALFDFTPEDVARGAVLQPGWYPLEVKKVEDGIAKTSGKPKVDVHFTVLQAIDASGSEISGVPIVNTFSPEYPSFALSFVNAIGGNVGKEGKKGINISNETCQGKRLLGYVKNDQYEGRTLNKLADFRPLDS